MAIYGGLGISQALFNFFMGAMFVSLTYYTSQWLHKVSIFIFGCLLVIKVTSPQAVIERVLHAPMSFFETTVSSEFVC